MKKLLKLALLLGGIAAVAKLVSAKKADWQGLTESEVRAKLDARLPDRMPPEKQAAVADKIVTTMRHRGVLREEEAASEAEGDDAVAVDTGAEESTDADTAEGAQEAEAAEEEAEEKQEEPS